MATHDVNLNIDDMLGVTFSPNVTANRGDTIRFNCTGGSGTISGFTTTYFTSGSSLNLSNGQSGTRVLKTNITSNEVIIGIAADVPGYSSKSITITIPEQQDSTPDPFNIPDQIDVNPKDQLSIAPVDINGTNTTMNASISGGNNSYFMVYRGGTSYEGPYTSISDCTSNDRFTLYTTAGDQYGDSDTVTFTVGTRTETFDVTVVAQPTVDQIVYLGIDSGTIRLEADIGRFFGYRTNVRLSDYVRGGEFVPDISQNNNIPTSPPLKLTDFYGSATAFYFIYAPYNQVQTFSLNGPSGLGYAQWFADVDFVIGFGDLATVVEYKYEVSYDVLVGDVQSDPNNQLVITSEAGAHETYALDNTWINIEVPNIPDQAQSWIGIVTVYARNSVDTSVEISRQAQFSINYFN